MSTHVVDAPSKGGRPRDPGVDERLLRSAIELYARRGWHGLSVRSVADGAGVSRSSVTTRWGSLADLLSGAFDHFNPPAPDDQADIRTVLLREASRMAAVQLGPAGAAFYRLASEATQGVEPVAPIWDRQNRATIRVLRRAIERAIAAGELPPTAQPRRLMDRLEGTVYMHILSTPPSRLAAVRRDIEGYIADLVDDLLGMEWGRAGGRRGGVAR